MPLVTTGSEPLPRVSFFLLPFPPWLVIGWWFVLQVLTALPQVSGVRVEAGVAVLAHVGGFMAGWWLVRPLLPRR